MPAVAHQRAAHHTPAHAHAHEAERPQVVPREPGGLVDPAQRRHPGSQTEAAAAPVRERADRVVVLDQERALVDLLTGRDRLAGQIEVGGDGEVGPRGVTEQPELRAEPRIEIQQVVPPVSGIQADIEVEQTAVPEPGEQRGDLVAELVVRHRAPEARQPGRGRVGPFFDAGEGWLADRVGVAVAVEEPVVSLAAGDEFLQHQPGARLLAALVDMVQFLLARHD